MFWYLVLTLVILIILIIIWWAIKTKSSNSTQPSITFPSKKYMEQIGGKCPDYWTYLGDRGNYNFCKNTYKVPVKNNNCYISGNNEIKNFTKYTKWTPTGDSLTDRCNWIKECGPQDGIDASWIGMDTICSNR